MNALAIWSQINQTIQVNRFYHSNKFLTCFYFIIVKLYKHPSSASCIHNPPFAPFLRGEERPFEARVHWPSSQNLAQQNKQQFYQPHANYNKLQPDWPNVPSPYYLINKSLIHKTDAKVHKTAMGFH